MHHWQDVIIAAGSVVIVAGLLPSVFGSHKPAAPTSIITFLVLSAFAISYATLKLWYATITTAMTALLWLVLAIQKLLQRSEP
jgi:hypothetical protein